MEGEERERERGRNSIEINSTGVTGANWQISVAKVQPNETVKQM
jgi:hypothetical protein